jgi:hypothetical protein
MREDGRLEPVELNAKMFHRRSRCCRAFGHPSYFLLGNFPDFSRFVQLRFGKRIVA